MSRYYVESSYGYMLRNVIAGYIVGVFLVFLRNSTLIFIVAAVACTLFLNLSHSDWDKMKPQVLRICISLMEKDSKCLENLSHHIYAFFCEWPVQFYIPLINWLVLMFLASSFADFLVCSRNQFSVSCTAGKEFSPYSVDKCHRRVLALNL